MKTRKLVVFLILIIALYGCANHGDRYDNNQTPNTDDINVSTQTPGMSYNGANSDGDATQGAPLPATPVTPAVQGKPSLIKMYVENSGSIFGYVKGTTEYVDALSDIAQHPDFISQGIPVDICFVNGKVNGNKSITITPIGKIFGNRLSEKGMNCGDVKYSDLNVMFDTVLANAKNNAITILVSDGIYDIDAQDKKNNNLNALTIKGRDTRTAFIRRLNDPTANLQTLLVKMGSYFDGSYYYSSKNGSTLIHQQRPYYLWIIGNSDMLNHYFSDNYLAGLNGYQNHVRYLKVGNNKLPFEFAFSDCIGNLVPDKNNSHALIRHKADHGQFELALIVDFGDLYYPDAYLTDCNNYSCDFKFNVSSVMKATTTQAISAGVSYKRPFLIKLTTNQPNPRGKLTIQLKNTQPSWIMASNATNEDTVDSNTTYGFSTLTKGIREAYEYVSDSIPAVFEITFK